MVHRLVFAVAETRSFERAAIALEKIGGNSLSAKTIERVAQEVGIELATLRDAGQGLLLPTADCPPMLAVVQCDGGRIRTRAIDQGPGVHDHAWRETKNACLVRMTCTTSPVDPQPELPAAFRDPRKVAEFAEKEPLSGLPPPASNDDAELLPERADWRPKRLLRTCLSSMVSSSDFGTQMASEAQQRQFFDASARAFLGDGLPWNWSIWQQHFSSFVPILDFIHALSYIYQAALVLRDDAPQVWSCYTALATACWQGRVDQVIAALTDWLRQQGVDAETKLVEGDPRQAVVDARRYLTNNRTRMDYPAYRRAGLPVTSALMESLVKEVNYRVKGSEMFWNDPAGAEAILQIRAAALSEDDRLTRYLANRPGHAGIRRSSHALAV